MCFHIFSNKWAHTCKFIGLRGDLLKFLWIPPIGLNAPQKHTNFQSNNLIFESAGRMPLCRALSTLKFANQDWTTTSFGKVRCLLFHRRVRQERRRRIVLALYPFCRRYHPQSPHALSAAVTKRHCEGQHNNQRSDRGTERLPITQSRFPRGRQRRQPTKTKTSA